MEKKPEEVPKLFKSRQHLEDFLSFFEAYVKHTNSMIDLCMKIGS